MKPTHLTRSNLTPLLLCFAAWSTAACVPSGSDATPTGDIQAGALPDGATSSYGGRTLPTAEDKRLLSHMSIVEVPDGAGGTRTTLRISGINVQVVNGLDATNGYPTDPDDLVTGRVQVNGAGNVIVGYGELTGTSPQMTRLGSHTISFGQGNGFAKFGNLIGSKGNEILGAFGSISGGRGHSIGDPYPYYNNENFTRGNSIRGGEGNSARGFFGSVQGGKSNSGSAQVYLGSASHSAIIGGANNSANGLMDSIGGGSRNRANVSEHGSIGGGYRNTLFLVQSASISGGRQNMASDTLAANIRGDSISGGLANTIYGYGADYRTISGGQLGKVIYSSFGSLAGGYGGKVGTSGSGSNASIAGGNLNESAGSASSVSGGSLRSAVSSDDWAAGALFEDD